MNIEGLSKSRLEQEEIVALFETCDIVGFCEVWVSGLDSLEVDGWSIFASKFKARRSRFGRIPGGLVVYVKNINLPFFEELSFDCEDIIWLKFERYAEQVVFGFAYNPPPGSVYVNADFFEELEHEVATLYDRGLEKVILLGDLNSRTGEVQECVNEGDHDERYDALPDFYEEEWIVPERSNMDKKVNVNGFNLLSFLKASNCRILNGRRRGDHTGMFTYVSHAGSSTIDYGIVSRELYYSVDSFEVVELTVDSGHFPLLASVELINKPLIQDHGCGDEEGPTTLTRFYWKPERERTREYITRFISLFSGMFLLLTTIIRSGEWGVASTYIEPGLTARETIGSKIDRSIQRLSDCFQQAAFPLRSASPSKKENSSKAYREPRWWNHSCQIAKSVWKRSLRTFRCLRTQVSLQSYLNAKKDYKNIRHRAQERLKNKNREDILNLKNLKDSKRLWSSVKTHIKPYTPTLNKISSEQWRTYFGRVFNFKLIEDRPEWNNLQMEEGVSDPILDSDISCTEVSNGIRNLKNGKAAGYDGIRSEMIKHVSHYLLGFFSYLFTKMLQWGWYPAAWVQSVVLPLYKGKGSKTDVNSYRGISLLPVLAKIFTHILNARLGRWLDEKGVTIEEQAGFRHGYSTVDNAFVMETLVSDRLCTRKNKLYACFFDFRKAFDSLPRAALWYKMHRIGIKGRLLRLLMDMYTKCSFVVRMSHERASEKTASTSGVFQGCLLSPTLYRIFINDIVEFCSGASVYPDSPCIRGRPVPALLYADDLVLFSESVEGLQRQIDKVREYCNLWGLEVNLDKTFCMVFRRGGRLAARENWSYGGSKLQVTSKFKYVGIRFTCGHAWQHHIQVTLSQARKVMFMLRKLTFRCGELPVQFLMHLFGSLVTPVILYGAEVWGMWSKPSIDAVENDFLRRSSGLPRGAPTSGVRFELSFTVSTYWKAREYALRYFAKTILLPDSRLSKQALLRQKELCESGLDCWGKRVKDLLQGLDLGDLWNNPQDYKLMKRRIKEAISKQAFGELLGDLHCMPSLKRYVHDSVANIESQRTKLMEIPFQSRRLIRCARLNLPTFAEKVTHDGDRFWRCRLCKDLLDSDEKWEHVLQFCNRVTEHRRNYGVPPDASQHVSSLSNVEVVRKIGFFLGRCHRVMKTIPP